MRTEDELNRIAYEIRGAGLRVHRKLGPGCFESAYAPCFSYELTKAGLEFQSKVPLAIVYESVFVPNAYEADYVIAGSIVVEIKALESLAPIHSRQLQTYLRLTGCPLGLILNFGALRFLDDVVRRVNNFPEGTAPHVDPNA